MPAFLAAPAPAERHALLNGLLEDSERLYHRNVTTIQKVFHAHWLKTVGEYVGRVQAEFPDEPPALVEAAIRSRLSDYRQELRRVQAVLIAQEREQHTGRDRGIRAYVASVQSQAQAA
jgi:hypothetical protein